MSHYQTNLYLDKLGEGYDKDPQGWTDVLLSAMEGRDLNSPAAVGTADECVDNDAASAICAGHGS